MQRFGERARESDREKERERGGGRERERARAIERKRERDIDDVSEKWLSLILVSCLCRSGSPNWQPE
jgi:hypothetical protein